MNPFTPLQAVVAILMCLIVGGSMTAIIFWFFKKLRLIEEERWGEGARWGAAIRHKGTQKRKEL